MDNIYSKIVLSSAKSSNFSPPPFFWYSTLAFNDLTFVEMTQFLIDHGANLPTNEQSTNELFHMIHLSHNYLHKDVIKTLFKNGVPVPNSYKNDPGVMQAQREITAENQEKTQGVSALTLEQKRRKTKFAMTMAQLLGIDPKYFKETPAPGTSTAT